MTLLPPHIRLQRLLRLLVVAAAVLLALALQGCTETFKGVLSNRVMVSVSQDSCATNSRWFGIALGADVDERDCKTIVDALRLRTAMEALSAAQAAAGR